MATVKRKFKKSKLTHPIKLTKRGSECAKVALAKKLPEKAEMFKTYFELYVWKSRDFRSVSNIK